MWIISGSVSITYLSLCSSHMFLILVDPIIFVYKNLQIPDIIFLHKWFILLFVSHWTMLSLYYVAPLVRPSLPLVFPFPPCHPTTPLHRFNWMPAVRDEFQEDDLSNFSVAKTLQVPTWYSKIFCLSFQPSHPTKSQNSTNVQKEESPYTDFP